MQKKLFQNETEFERNRVGEGRKDLSRANVSRAIISLLSPYRIEARFHLVPVRRAEGVRPCRIAEKGLPAA